MIPKFFFTQYLSLNSKIMEIGIAEPGLHESLSSEKGLAEVEENVFEAEAAETSSTVGLMPLPACKNSLWRK